MKHTLDHTTATEAAGGIWELCTSCEAWVRHNDPRDGCEGSGKLQPPPLELEDAYKSLFGQIQQLRNEVQMLRTEGKGSLHHLWLRFEKLDEDLRYHVSREVTTASAALAVLIFVGTTLLGLWTW